MVRSLMTACFVLFLVRPGDTTLPANEPNWTCSLTRLNEWVYVKDDTSGGNMFIDPAKAGPDFEVQGEYVGKIGNKLTLAAQVMALGNGRFDGILFLGGLPGNVWDEQTKSFLIAERRGDTTYVIGKFGERLRFSNPNIRGTIQDGVFQGSAKMFRNRLEDVSFILTKIHRKSPTLGAKPPPNALVLFDGRNTDEWDNGRTIDGNLLNVGTRSKRRFKDHFVHLEFRCPLMPTARGMQRGNSGAYVRDVWEVQIVDSFGWHAENRKFIRLSISGKCGGIH